MQPCLLQVIERARDRTNGTTQERVVVLPRWVLKQVEREGVDLAEIGKSMGLIFEEWKPLDA